MGFGFNLGMVFIIFPMSVILLIAWAISGKKIFRSTLGIIWIGIICLVLLAGLVKWFRSKTFLDKEDYYGEYVIDRSYFKGKQTDWQYNHFRFTITQDDSIHFHVTEFEKIVRTYHGTIKTTTPYQSARLILQMQEPTHHVISSNPTTYRDSWNFHLVFKSPIYHNMYFVKDEWTRIEN